jgi:hypothetical protein
MSQALRVKMEDQYFSRDNFIRIPFSGILIKIFSLRSLRLCGEIIGPLNP